MFILYAALSRYSRNPIIIIALLFALINCSCRSSGNREDLNHQVQTDIIIDNTNDLLNSGQVRQSKTYLDSAYRTIAQTGPIDRWKKYNYLFNFYMNYDYNPDLARQYTDSMLAIVINRKYSYKEEYAWTVFAIGDALMTSKKYAEAFKHYYEGREFTQRNLDDCRLCNFTSKLGQVRFNQGQYLKAISYLKQALVENNQCKVDSNFSDVFGFPQSNLNTIALGFERAGMPDSAIVYYKNAIAFIDKLGNRFPKKKQFVDAARGVIYGNLGGTYKILNRYEESERYLKESIRINDRRGYELRDAQTAKIKLADLYIQNSNFTEAEKLLNELQIYLALPGKTPVDENIRLKWSRLKWMYFDKKNDISKAYTYAGAYRKILDSTNKANMKPRTADMDLAFRENEQQYKLKLLSKESELKTGYLTAAGLFLLIAVGVLLAVWQNRKRLKTLNEKITAQNADMYTALSALQQSQEENTHMMKIVAHDLRSPMAATISITTMLLEYGNLLPEDAGMLELMKTSSLHSLEMIADLLNMNTEPLHKDT